MPASFTQKLLKSDPVALTSATQTPFLSSAGRGRVPKSTLSLWLSQDRLYAQSYIPFIGSLISRVRLPVKHIPFPEHDKDRQWRIAELLMGSLENIKRELQVFEDSAARYGLSVQTEEKRKVTEEYVDLFLSFTDPKRSLLEGLVVLWATEKCYLLAWQFAKGQGSEGNEGTDGDEDGGALRKEFIPNWTNKEFVGFVETIAGLVDEIAEEAPEQDMKASEDVYRHVLKVEKGFWPEMK